MQTAAALGSLADIHGKDDSWIAAELSRSGRPRKVLDLGCGAGALSNELAKHGHRVTGLDASLDHLSVAGRSDVTRKVAYHHGDATRLPYADGSFDAVCAVDLLEHVAEPEQVLAEAARVLAPRGVFFFETSLLQKNAAWFSRHLPAETHELTMFSVGVGMAVKRPFLRAV